MIRPRSGQIAAWIVALSMAGYPMVAGVAALFKLPNTQLSIALRGAILGLSMLVILHRALSLRSPPRHAVMIIALLVLYGMRLVYQTNFDSKTLGLAPSQYWIWYLGVTCIPTLAVLMAINLDHLLLRRVLASILTVAGVLIVYKGSTEGVSDGVLLNTGRVALDALNPISVGNVGAALALISIWELFGRRAPLTTRRLLWMLALVLGLYLLFISASRGPLVGMCAALFIMGLSLPLKYKLWFLLGVPALFVPMMMYLLTIESSLNISFISRLFEVGTDSDLSSTIRGDLYATALALIREYPILGSGIEIQAYASYPHNFFLEYFMATGVFAGAFAIFVMGSIFLRASRLVNSGKQSGAFGLLFLATFVGAQFSAAVYSNAALWVLAAVVVVSVIERKQVSPRFRVTYRAAGTRNI